MTGEQDILPKAEAATRRLDTPDIGPFLHELAVRCNHNQDILSRARRLLVSKPPGTFTAQEVIADAMEGHRNEALKNAYASQMTRTLK